MLFVSIEYLFGASKIVLARNPEDGIERQCAAHAVHVIQVAEAST
jgi:hypothetical protein